MTHHFLGVHPSVYLHAISSHAKIILYLNGNGDIV